MIPNGRHNVISVFRLNMKSKRKGWEDMGQGFSALTVIKKTTRHQLETGMKRIFFISTLVFALTAALLTTGYAETQTETAGYGHAQTNNKGSMEGQPGHMEKCAMMMRRAGMMKMMKKVMEIERKILLVPAEGEKKEMIKELDLMMEKIDKMMSRMQRMMNETMGGAAGGYPAVEHQHKKETDAGK